MRKFFTIKLVTLLVLSSGFLRSSAQIVADGLPHNVVYNGTFQDFVIPNNTLITKIRFTLSGADGGAAVLHMGQNIPVPFGDDIFLEATSHRSGGGSGAVVTGTFLVGTGAGKIPHGATVRFIIGQKGESGHDNISVIPNGGTGSEYGGGGGGTAVLYRSPGGSTWFLLGVAGAGGGAYQGVVLGVALGLGSAGGPGLDNVNGGNGGGVDFGAGGLNGGGGNRNIGVVAISPMAAGGGGRFANGNGLLTYVDIINPEDPPEEVEIGEGGAGAPGGTEIGGYGGNIEDQPETALSLIFEWRDGGYGYGGGGVGVGTGGGGGGYSGGGAGGLFNGGGGGGSYLNGIRESGNFSSGGSDTEPDDGLATYQVTLNHPPVAACKNKTVYLDANGLASIIASDVDNGSSDPDGTPLTYGLSKSNFTCADLGNNSVVLTVTDDYGATATCTAIVTVVDNIVPVITCLANVTVSCAADVAVANPALVTVTDNCSTTVTHEGDVISNQTCANRFTITRTYKAKDASGNSATCQQVITVFDDQAPVISNSSVNLPSLWPPNHKMRDVIVNYNIADNCATATASLSVSSNEPINGTGDGDISPDWQIVNNHLVKLRAERAGIGSGRVYTITITANDGCNNISTKALYVYVNFDNSITARPGLDIEGSTVLNEQVNGLVLNVQPNPSPSNFRISVNSSDSKTPIQLRVFNAAGQIVEITKPGSAKTIFFGDKEIPGVYLVEAVQGKNRTMIKLIKL